ncbi:MAG TPA: SMP-30/gluconolactonase/LRE family protein [Lacipirellulaceae bacterium]|nr:SMP-30/gluconolactonase/LRE family protein [Lacipirellulaceae bacterium]
MATSMQTEVPIERFEIFANGLDHPECCAFDRDGILWAGGEAGQLYRIDPQGKAETIANLGGFCCGVALSPDDRELFVCVSGVGIVRATKSGKHSVFASHAGEHKIVAPNYLLFDRRGRLYVTDSGNWMKRKGFVTRFDRDGHGEVLAGPFGYANGLALTADQRYLFMVESDSDSILRFEISADDKLSEPEIYADQVGRLPDGIALDAEGNLYVCCYASDEIWRIGAGGRKTLLAHDRWGILLGRPTNLAFGGKDFDVIYVANLARYTITRANIGFRGQPLTNFISQRSSGGEQ